MHSKVKWLEAWRLKSGGDAARPKSEQYYARWLFSCVCFILRIAYSWW